MNNTIRVGSKVIAKNVYLTKLQKRIGTVVLIDEDDFLGITQYLVDFGDGFNGHDGNGFKKGSKNFWYLFEHEIKLISNKKGNVSSYV